MLTSQR